MVRNVKSRSLTLIIVLVMALPALAVAVPAAADEDRLNDGFYSFPEIEAKLHSAAENYSDITALYDLGKLYPNDNGTRKTSHEGRTFWALKISDNPDVNESDEPDILYVGLHHAREWMTTEMLMWLMDHILADYGVNDTITQLVDTREIWLFPVFNPDGFVYTETHDRTWRKNRRDNGDGSFGVDPNRNYGYEWGHDDVGSDPNPGGETYRGPAPFSEPCTQIMRDFVLDVGIDRGISFHTYSEVMGFPPAYSSFHVPDYPFFRELGRRMFAHNGYVYGDIADGVLYEVNGGFDDWMYFNASALTFTIEMNSLAQGGFYVDASLIVPTCTMNYEAALEMAKAPVDLYDMFDAGIDGTVMDPRGEPVEGAAVHAELIGEDTYDVVTGPEGTFSFKAPYDRFYPITVTKDGFSSHSESHQARWRDRLTQVNITIHDNVAPSISRVAANHDGEEGTDFGIGQTVRIDVWDHINETGLEGTVSIESFGGQYYHRNKPLEWDEGTSSYHYEWDTSGLKPRSDYIVTTQLWDIDDNRDKDGVMAGEPDLTLTLRDITPPMVPLNLTMEAPPGGGALIVSWEANDDDTEAYTLERKRGTSGLWQFLINLTREDTTFTDQGLENDVTYSYRLRAWDKVPLPSAWSQEITGTPRDLVPPGMMDPPTLNAPPEGGVLEVTWNEATDDAATYVLYKNDGTGFKEVAEFPRGTLRYVDEDVVNDKPYYYQVSAKDASGNEGPRSLEIRGTPRDVTPPGLPVVEPLPTLTNVSELQVRGTAEPLSTVYAVVDNVDAGTYQVDEDGTFTGDLELVSGINRVSFKCFDMSFNPSGSTEPVLVQVDLNAPHVTSTFPSPDERDVPVTEMVTIIVSEGLVDGSVTGHMTDTTSGEEVPATVTYSSTSKTISVVPTTQLDKGATYTVVVDGTDPAGNHLTGGRLSFTTVKPVEPEPTLSASMVLMIVVLVIVVALVALLLVMRSRRPPPAPVQDGTAWDQYPPEGYGPEGNAPEAYPGEAGPGGGYPDQGWEKGWDEY